MLWLFLQDVIEGGDAPIFYSYWDDEAKSCLLSTSSTCAAFSGEGETNSQNTGVGSERRARERKGEGEREREREKEICVCERERRRSEREGRGEGCKAVLSSLYIIIPVLLSRERVGV